MRPIELTPTDKAAFNSLTQIQKDVITIFYERLYEINYRDEFWTLFPQAMSIDVVDAATYLNGEHYLIFRSITPEQKQAVVNAYHLNKQMNDAQMMYDFDDQEVYNMHMSYDVYALYRLFTLMSSQSTFKFFNNQNNN